ncbi:MAG: hypothetical protein ACP5UF_07390 [Hydrogenobaculum sp.]
MLSRIYCHYEKKTIFVCKRYVGSLYLKLLFEEQGKTIEVVNGAEEEKEDVIQDFVAVIYSFSAKLYGLRRAKRKTEKIIKEITQENEND